jgi:hypothetical protein
MKATGIGRTRCRFGMDRCFGGQHPEVLFDRLAAFEAALAVGDGR